MAQKTVLDLGNLNKYRYIFGYAPVAQLDRVLPSEGKGRTFESSRVRHRFLGIS